MRRLACLAFILCAVAAPVAADPAATAAPSVRACADLAAASAKGGPIQLAQSSCRGDCSSSRGYCLSTCRDSFCRAVCNDRYQSCLASCRR